jgi:hypothetical protein
MSKIIDETGKKYGNLTVIKRVENGFHGHATWLCQCDCGGQVKVMGTDLRRSHIVSCGCNQKSQLINEAGNQYGKLTVIEYAGGGKPTSALWLCQCDCGKRKVISGRSLRAGYVRSCGCLHPKPKGEAAFNYLVHHLKRRAKEKGLEYTLTNDQVFELTKQSCFYCGGEPHQEKKVINGNGNFVYNGLDRIDTKRGYTIDNVVPCCGTCNHAKALLSKDEFRILIRKIYQNWAGNNL